MTEPTSLARHDPDPSGRAQGLARSRSDYTYDYAYQDLCFTGDLPKSESFDAPYMAQSLAATAAFEAERMGTRASSFATGVLDRLRGQDAPDASDEGRVTDPAEYDAMIARFKRPLAADAWRDPSRADLAFAWQRIAGAVPTLLRGVKRVPSHFAVTQTHLDAALARFGVAPRRLEALADEGRLFLADYARFDGIPCGTYPPRVSGRDASSATQKFLAAPMALFTSIEGTGLLPIAIQCGQRPDARTPIVTPADGARWLLAKTIVQTADANLEGIVVHFGYTHMLAERFILAARRQLSPRHPLLALLAPHFRYTLAANAYARKTLVVPDGTQDRVLAPRLEATLAILRESVREIRIEDLDPRLAAKNAGLEDTSALAHPFRDDQLTVFEGTRRWVEGYVDLAYASDEDVATDVELAAMVDEIGSPDGGRLRDLCRGMRLATRADVTDFCARIVHRVSTYHAGINYGWYDWMAYVPNMPAATSMPMPTIDQPVDDASWLAMMPPRGLGWGQLAQVHGVDAIHVSFLGQYPEGFADPRVAPLLGRFRADLEAAEQTIGARNATRLFAYPHLLPSRTTASIES
ncbi:MAG: hypothetical protein J0L92_13100 [Deltaproteobacteria bacterium]|nr:hypothetical protein [Deltaproteobacteria bacterium]